MQEFESKNVTFIAQQDGPIEKVLTSKLASFFRRTNAKLDAYLCRVHYGNPNQISIAICLASQEGKQVEIVDGISRIFQELFAQHEHVDIIFIGGEQLLSIAQNCDPFYEWTRLA